MFEKPCRRPSCSTPVRKAMRSRLNAAFYCSIACGAQHRVELGSHPFHHRTAEQRHRNAVIGGKTRAARAHRRKLLEVAAKVDRHVPPHWRTSFTARDLARITALVVRGYLEGHEDGYQAGHTASWRARQKGKAAA